MNPAVGIDLGTTNTVVAIQTNDTGPELLLVPQPLDQRDIYDELDHIKSVVYFEDADAAVVGAFAGTRLNAFRSIKSKMGTRWRARHPFDPERVLTPPHISAHVLKAAFDALVKRFPSWDRRAVVTVPASFNTDQRRDTLLAASWAGFDHVQLLDEPTAAFYYYFDQNRESIEHDRPQTVLVFDFGGGTLDVSIIRVRRQGDAISIDPIGRSRYNNLGGDDIDIDLAAFFYSLWTKRSGTTSSEPKSDLQARLYQLFIRKASAFKEEVEDYIANGLEPNEFAVNETLQGTRHEVQIHQSVKLTRAQYEEATGAFFNTKSDINIFRPIGQAIAVAQEIAPDFRKDRIDFVLYTGGASRMAAVRASLDYFFSPTRCFPISHEEALHTVALGAASCQYDQMRHQRGVVMTQRLLECVLTRSDDGTKFIPIVPLTAEPTGDFTPVPHEFTTRRAVLTLKLPLFRGAGPSDHNLSPMQDLVLPFDSVLPKGSRFRLFYRVTENKTLELGADVERTQGPTLRVMSEVDMHGGPAAQAADPQLAKVNRNMVP